MAQYAPCRSDGRVDHWHWVVLLLALVEPAQAADGDLDPPLRADLGAHVE